MQGWSGDARARGEKIVLVPTMGFLHDGHRELLRIGKDAAGGAVSRGGAGGGGKLVLSIFVNPTQFGPREDYRTYPSDLKRDLRIAEEGGVDAVFTPSAEEMYGVPYQTFVEVEELTKHLCGRSRPGHFRGVATVVLKLFNIVKPHEAIFGKKDYQQLMIIKRLVKDLNLEVEVTGVETVRENDGLAMSSRNSYLNPDERKAASVIPMALDMAEELFLSGVMDSSGIKGNMKKIIEKEPLAVVEYMEVVDPDTLRGVEHIKESALVAIAVKIGKARLIDNRSLKG